MTDDRIEAKALALANEVLAEWGVLKKAVEVPKNSNAFSRALLRAIEQHEAFKQEVSDAVEYALATPDAVDLRRFIIPKPKPDPLVEAMKKMGWYLSESFLTDAEKFRDALDARGWEIREKGQ
jgi:hypothetical protein